MALRKEENELLKVALETQQQQQLLMEQILAEKRPKSKPFYIKALQFSTVILSLVLFITIGAGGILLLSKPGAATAANTYTETWTATNAIHTTMNAQNVTYATGIPANGSSAGTSGQINPGFGGGVTVTAWSVSGTIN